MKKKLIFMIALLFLSLISLGVKVKADTLTTSANITCVGAQIRTTDPSGIRFVSEVNLSALGITEADVEVYGTLVAYGTGDASDLSVTTATFNGKSVMNIEATALADSANGRFYGSVIGFVESLYDLQLTVRPYIKKTDGTFIYSATSMVKSLAEGAVNAINAGISTELITNVATYLSNNYCVVNMTPNAYKQLTISPFNTVKYQFSNLNALYAEFIADANITGLTTSSDFETFKSKLQTPGSASELTTSFALVKLFDGTKLAKWSWLLDYLKAFNNNYVTRQANALLTTRAYGDYNYFADLVASLWNFFHTTEEEALNGTSIKFANEAAYVNCPWPQATSFTDSNVKKVGSTVTMPAAATKDYYDFDSYYDGVNDYLVGASYTIASKNVVFETIYTPTEYDVEYYDGSTKLSIQGRYNYTASCTLANAPGITKAGYAFVGWHLEEDLSDSVVTQIPVHSSGTKKLYAEWQALSTVNKSLNAKEVNVLNTVTPDIIVIPGASINNYALIGDGLNASYSTKTFVWEESVFATLSDAADKVTSGQTIFVLSGTLNYDSTTISVENVKVYGANYNNNTDFNYLSNFTNSIITVTGKNVEINGLNLDKNSGINLNSLSGYKGGNIIRYCRFSGTIENSSINKINTYRSGQSTNYYGKIRLYRQSNVTVEYNTFAMGYTNSCAIIAQYLYLTSNIKNNKFIHSGSSYNYYGIYLEEIRSTVNIDGNTFNCNSQYGLIRAFPYYDNTYQTNPLEKLNITNNTISNIKVLSGTGNFDKAFIRIEKASLGSPNILIEGNIIDNTCSGYPFNFGTNTGSDTKTVTIQYNSIEIEYNFSSFGVGTMSSFTTNHNYYSSIKESTSRKPDTSTETTYASREEVRAAYTAYLATK